MTQINIAILQTSDSCRIATILIDPAKPCAPQLMKWSMLFEASKDFPDLASAEAHPAPISQEIDVNRSFKPGKICT